MSDIITKAGAEETKMTARKFVEQKDAESESWSDDTELIIEYMQEYANLHHSEQKEKEASIQLSGAGEQLYRMIKMSERKPAMSGYYQTTNNELYYVADNDEWRIQQDDNYPMMAPTYWLEPVNLPMPVEEKTLELSGSDFQEWINEFKSGCNRMPSPSEVFLWCKSQISPNT